MDPWPSIPRPTPVGIVIREATAEERRIILGSPTPAPFTVPLDWHLSPREVRALCGTAETFRLPEVAVEPLFVWENPEVEHGEL